MGDQRMTYSIVEFAEIMGISRTSAYALAARNELGIPVLKLGRRLMVSKASVDRLLGIAVTEAARSGQEPTSKAEQ